MSAPAPVRRLRLEEFLAIPFDDDARVELLDGCVYISRMARVGHGRRATRVDEAMSSFVRTHDLQIISASVKLPGDSGADAVLAVASALGAPGLCVEVLSQGHRDEEVAEIAAHWLGAGAARVWVVRSRPRSVTVYRRDQEPRFFDYEAILTSDDAGFAVDGFEMQVAEIFGRYRHSSPVAGESGGLPA